MSRSEPVNVLEGDPPIVLNLGNAPEPEPTPEATPEPEAQASRVASQVSGTASISGTKFNDINGNNQVDPGELGLSGFTIYLDLNQNNVLDSNEPTSITNAEGAYSFQALPASTYVVKEVQQPGFTQITPDPVVTIAEGENAEFVNIGNQADGGTSSPSPAPTPVNTSSTGQIQGVKFDDRDGDGLADTDEPRIVGVEIFIYLNNNGLPELNEPFTRTDEHGEYQFTLPPGNFRLRETPPPGLINTTPTPVVTVVPGQTVFYNFGNSSIFDPNTSIGGIIFTDSNNNGIQDDGEPGIPTAQVFLDIDGDGTFDSSEYLNGDGVLNEGEDIDGDGILDVDEPETFTVPDGRYVFNGLIPGGIYRVNVVLQENLFLTDAAPLVIVSTDSVPFDPNITPEPINLILAQEITDVDVGVNVTSPTPDTVSGIVFADNNANGLFEPLKGEVGLPGVEVFVDTHRD